LIVSLKIELLFESTRMARRLTCQVRVSLSVAAILVASSEWRRTNARVRSSSRSASILAYGRSLLTVHLQLALRRYSRGTAEDALAESKSPNKTPIVLSADQNRTLRVLVPHLHILTNSLTIVTKPSPHESNPDRARSVYLRLRVWSPQRGLRDTRATVRARAIGRTRVGQLVHPLLSRHVGLKIAPAISLDTVMSSVTWSETLEPGPSGRPVVPSTLLS